MNFIRAQFFFLLTSVFAFATALSLHGANNGPFVWTHSKNPDGIEVKAEVPPDSYLYKDSTSVKAFSKDRETAPLKSPQSIAHKDKIMGDVQIYPAGSNVWKFTPETDRVEIEFQGCKAAAPESPAVCFMPGHLEIDLNGKSAPPVEKTKAAKTFDSSIFEKFGDEAVIQGYTGKSEFLAFLKGENKGTANILANKSMIIMLLLILIGGLGLNLTPCILPMIPINLAIIGAGTNAASKSSGFLRGGVYGLGIALSYGALGLFSSFTGTSFGTLNSLWYFNLIIALIFIVLALAMFEIFTIDFSRFGAKINITPAKAGAMALLPVFAMGAISALLAGACVAPVVIAVLLQSSALYSQGEIWGLALPFVLGLGMALPWPFAGAGLAVMPKPGKWLIRVKQIFATLILLAGLYYLYTSWTLLPSSSQESQTLASSNLEDALKESQKTGKAVLIDVWASWCKNCTAMEHTTLADKEVRQEMEKFIFVKYQAENPSAPETEAFLKYFGIQGLPAYIILKP